MGILFSLRPYCLCSSILRSKMLAIFYPNLMASKMSTRVKTIHPTILNSTNFFSLSSIGAAVVGAFTQSVYPLTIGSQFPFHSRLAKPIVMLPLQSETQSRLALRRYDLKLTPCVSILHHRLAWPSSLHFEMTAPCLSGYCFCTITIQKSTTEWPCAA